MPITVDGVEYPNVGAWNRAMDAKAEASYNSDASNPKLPPEPKAPAKAPAPPPIPNPPPLPEHEQDAHDTAPGKTASPHPGADMVQWGLDQGRSPAEMLDWKARRKEFMLKAGAPPAEVDKYWGDNLNPNTDQLDNIIRANVGAQAPAVHEKMATNALEALQAGLQTSVSGLVWRGRNPDTILPQDAGMLHKVASGIGTFAGDLPAIGLGAIAGGVVGAGVGSTVPIAGSAAGAVVGAGAGSAGLPEALRQSLMDQYAHPEGFKTWADFWNRASSAVWDTSKAAAAGAVAYPVGRYVGGALASRGVPAIAASTANVASYAVTSTAVGGALGGQVPDAAAFTEAAAVALTLHGAGTVIGAARRFVPSPATEQVAENLRDIYSRTGLHPHDAVREAIRNPDLEAEILAPRAADGEVTTPVAKALAPPEPPPFTPENKIEPPPLARPRLTDKRFEINEATESRKVDDNGIESRRYRLTEDGKSIGGAMVSIKDGIATIDTIAGPGLRVGEGTNTFGPGQMRTFARQFFADNPDVTAIQGKRISGARTGTDQANEMLRITREQVMRVSEPAKPEIEPGAATRLTIDPRVQGIGHGQEPVLKEILEDASKRLPPGWHAEIISAERPGAVVAGTNTPSQHASAAAMDIVLIGPDGKRHTNIGRGPGTPEFDTYRQFAQEARNAVERLHPELHGQFEWGGNFTSPGPNQYDLMHFSLGSERGLGNEARTPATGDHLYAPTPGDVTPAHLNIFRTLENSGDHDVSPAGAIGRGQIMPDTARSYGFDPSRLHDPAYNETVTKAIISDLSVKFDGNLTDMLVAYNAGPGRARQWIANGRKISDLPVETQKYLENADRHGFTNNSYLAWGQIRRQLTVQGESGAWVPPDGEPLKPSEHELMRQAREGDRGGEPPRLPPREGAAVEEPPGGPRKVETDRIRLNDDMALDQMSDIVAPDKAAGTPDWMNPRKIIEGFRAQLTPARRIDNAIGLGPRELGVEDMLRQTFASKERAGVFIRWGVLDPITLGIKHAASWMSAFKAVKEDGGTNKGFMEYRLAARTLEKAAQGVKTGIDVEKARDVMSRPSIRAKYERGTAILRMAKDGAIDYARDSGLFTPTQAEAIKSLNREHIIFRRVFDPDYNPPHPGRGFGVRAAVRKMTGSQRQIVDPMTAEIDNLHTIIAMADRNRAVGAVIGVIEGKQGPGFAGQKLLWHDRTEGSPSRPHDIFDENGNPIAPEEAPGLEPFLAERGTGSGGLRPDEFAYFRNGKREIWRAVDPDLAALMRMPVTGKINPVAEALSKFAGLARLGIVQAIDFPFRATLHGQLAASAFSRGGNIVPFQDAFHGLMDVWNQGDNYKRWVANGGAGTALTDMDVNYIKKDVNEIFDATGTTTAVWNSFLHPIDALRSMYHMIDAASRVGAMQRLENRGYSTLKAATLSRTAYLDNAEGRTASWLNTWARMVPFMEIGFKDVEQVASALYRKPIATMVIAGTVLTMPTVMNYALNYLADQGLDPADRYDQVPRWERDLYWVTPPINGVRMKIKRPYVGGFLFSTLPERFLDFARQDANAFKEWAETFVAQVVPPFIPTALAPIEEQRANKSFLTNRPLVKASLEKVSDYMQYGPNTSLWAQKLAQAVGPAGSNWSDVSPIVLENYAKQWLGPLPMTIARVLETPFRPEGKPWETADVPFLGAFFARHQPGQQTVQDFYDAKTEFEKAHGDVAVALKEGDFSKVSSHQLLQAGVSLHTFSAAMQQQRNALDIIYRSKMTNDEKRKYTDAVGRGMLANAKAGLSIIDTVKAIH